MPETSAAATTGTVTGINVLNTTYTKFKSLVILFLRKAKCWRNRFQNGTGLSNLTMLVPRSTILLILSTKKARSKFTIKISIPQVSPAIEIAFVQPGSMVSTKRLLRLCWKERFRDRPPRNAMHVAASGKIPKAIANHHYPIFKI